MAIVLAVLAVVTVVRIDLAGDRGRIDVSRSDGRDGPLVVAVDDGRARGGVFWLPTGAVLADALQAAGIKDLARFARTDLKRPLGSGVSIGIRRPTGGEPEVVIGPMRPEMRLALDMPIDVNTAGVSDLMLIPGIGKTTAEKILVLRRERKRIYHLNELLAVKGIKEKRLGQLTRYLYVAAMEVDLGREEAKGQKSVQRN